MADYKYSEMLSMQEQAIKRVNEMKRRERAAAQTANRELYGKGKAPQKSQSGGTAGKLTSLPVDYLHSGERNRPQSQAQNQSPKGVRDMAQNRESGNIPQSGQNNGSANRGAQSRDAGGRNSAPSSWAQNAVQRREAPRREPQKSPARNDSSAGFLEGINLESDTLLLLGLLYILGKEKADYSLMFALFYILM